MPERVFVVGVGMTDFVKPSSRPEWDYPDMVREAGTQAIEDAGVRYEDVQHVGAGWCFGDTTAGQRAVYELGLTGVPVVNVNNACATGSTALMVARNAVAAGMADCALAVGFEKMGKVNMYSDRAYPLDKHIGAMASRHEGSDALITAQMFGNAGREHMERYGTRPESFARIAVKNHKHSVNNPRAQFRKEFSLEEVLASPMMYPPLTLLQCCPTSSGAAAAVVASEDVVRRLGVRDPIWVAASVSQSTVESEPELTELTARTAREAYRRSGIGPDELGMVELHEAATIEEIQYAESLGLCPEGRGGVLVEEGATAINGRIPINTSGGLLAMGHPFGPTGLGQIAEIFWQLRGEAGERQIPARPRTGLAHMVGLGGTCIVHVLQR